MEIMGIRVHVGKLFQHGLKDATPRRMSTFINTRIINLNLNPTLSFCNTLHEEEQAKVTDAPLPTYSLPKQEHVQEEGKGGEAHDGLLAITIACTEKQ